MINTITGSCADGVPDFLFLDFNIAPKLLYYAYIPVLLISIILGLYIYKRNKKSILNRIFGLITLFFSLWVLNIILQWIAIPNYYIYLSWKITGILELPIFLLSIYFIDVFYGNSDISKLKKIILSSIYIIVLILSFTNLNLTGYNFEKCEGILGPLWYFIYGVEFISLLWITFTGFKYYEKGLKKSGEYGKKILLFTIGLVIFLGIFWFSNAYAEVTSFYEMNLVGPIGMVIFLGLMTYLMIRYHTFNVKLFATEALVWGLIFLIGSQFFFIKTNTNFVLNGVTFLGVIIFGQSLIKSVKVEIEQRKNLENLTNKLSQANDKLKDLDKLKTEFVSLASHQLRSPLTAIKGYASMLMEGDYGDMSKEAKDAIDRMYESSKNLTIVVEDLLDVTKIESGGMKYEMVTFDLSAVAEDEAKDFTVVAEKKGLKLTFEKDDSTYCTVNGDKEKLRQIIINFIDNSVKYTKEGEINISVRNKGDKVLFCVKDTGMGMTEEIKESLFHKFARGEGAKMNTTGTGLGLYLAKQIVEAHNGRVWVESDGPGLGSAFFMELKAECCKVE